MASPRPAPGSRRAPTGRPAELSALLVELMTHIHRRSAGDTLAIMHEGGLTMPQLVTLHLLDHAGGRPVGTIAECLRLSPAATSHLVERLVRGGLVERSEDPEDRRQRQVVITARGRTLVERVCRERARELSVVLGRLSAELRRELGAVLARAIDELEERP